MQAAATTTGVFVYGVVPSGADLPPGLAGIDDAPVHVIETEAGGVGAVVSELGFERPPGRRADLVAYGRVLDALALRGPVAPVRFGSILEDELSVIEDLLVPGADRFGELLADLDGRVQFNLRATYDQQAVLAEVVGADAEVAHLHRLTRDLPTDTAYAERVRLGELVSAALEEKRVGDADVVMRVVTPYVVADRLRLGSGVDELLTVSLLVDAGRQGDLEQALEGLAEAVHERIRLRLVGPVAAYDFVEEA